MIRLENLQQQWQQAILHGETAPLLPMILSPLRDSADVRARIYTEGYMARLQETLRTTYPALYQYLGDSAFENIAEAYIRANPSHYFSIVEIGRALPKFLQQTFSTEIPHDLVSYEMAALEWEICSAVDKADAPLIQKEDLLKIPQDHWENLTFSLHPSLAMLTLQTNVLTLYQAYAQQSDFPVAETQSTHYCRVWRKAQQVYYLSMSMVEYQFMVAIQQQKTLAEICEVLCAHLPENEVIDFAIQQLLRWMEEGVLAGVHSG